MKPIIGLNTTLLDMGEPLKAKAACHLKYIDAVVKGGGVPLILPPVEDIENLPRLLAKLDGFCLIGGPDYLPEAYGGHAQPESDLMDARRHRFDLMLADELLNRTTLPVLGICGGHQLMNISRGGALVQDLQSEWAPPEEPGPRTLEHSDDQRCGDNAGNAFRHEVSITPGCLLERIAGGGRIVTNSYHHQAVNPKKIGQGFKATAWSPDGVIEALEATNGTRFLLGVQWHPERLADEPQHLALFQALVAAAGK